MDRFSIKNSKMFHHPTPFQGIHMDEPEELALDGTTLEPQAVRQKIVSLDHNPKLKEVLWNAEAAYQSMILW